MSIAYYDIESCAIDKLEGQRSITTIHSIAVAVDDGEPLVFTSHPTSYSDGTLLQAIDLINSCEYACGHNNVGFDLPVLEQVLGVPIISKQIDTMILAKLVYTKDALLVIDRSLGWHVDSDSFIRGLQGSFGLYAFGLRLGEPKLDFSDWSKLSEEMCIYNKQDVVVTRKLHQLLLSRPTYPPKHVIDIEMETAQIIHLQRDYGFYFDKPKAELLRDRLLHEKFTIKRELLAKYKPLYLPSVVAHPHTILPAKARKVRTWMYHPHFGTKPGENPWWKWEGKTNLTNKLLKQPDVDTDED